MEGGGVRGIFIKVNLSCEFNKFEWHLYSTIQRSTVLYSELILEVSSIPYQYHYDHFQQGRIYYYVTRPCFQGILEDSPPPPPAAKQMQGLGFHDQIRKCQMFAPVNSLCSVLLTPKAWTVSCRQNYSCKGESANVKYRKENARNLLIVRSFSR